MNTFALKSFASLLALGAGVAAAAPALAQSRQVPTANVTNVDGPTGVTLNGTTFVNQGVVGAGRLGAGTLDFRGETLGSFSGMALDLKTWKRNADGSYASNMFTLPDRGPLDGAIDYRNRVHTESILFKPLAGGTSTLPQVPASQSQVTITPTGGFTLKDANGIEMTGRDPGANTETRGGIVYPVATDGTAAGRISLDAEAIAFRPDGTFYVSDEYADGIYYFDAAGKQLGAIQTVSAMLPRTGGNINFNSTTPGQTGRRNNQGLEAMALTPDNKRLVTIQQSATVQDTNGANQQTRNNTRILVYDISGGATPANPIGHYVLQLPVFSNNGNGTIDRTAAQSEMLALNDTQFLVLARDGIGRGVAANASTSTTPVFKSILLVDTAGATNLAGTTYETTNTPIATNGNLASGITAVQQVELVNMLNPTQLARVGMNLNRLPLSNSTTLSEKIEAMALAPVLEENAPQDFFLFVGNDNDFQATNAVFNGTSYVLGAGDGTGNNDSVMLVYRVTLPTYVDPMALAALNVTAPAVLTGTRVALNGLAKTTTLPAMQFLNAQRGFEADAEQTGKRRFQLWTDGGWSKIGGGGNPATGLDVHTLAFTMGLDLRLGDAVRIGAFGGYRELDGKLSFGAPLQAKAWTAGGYIATQLPGGLYAQAAGAWLGDVKFAPIERYSVYDQTAVGRTRGQGWNLSGELGWTFQSGKLSFGPFVAADYSDLELDGWRESGASVSNLVFPKREFRKLTATVGGEVGTQIGALRPALRAGYSFEREYGDKTALVSLASAQHAMGSVSLPLADTERDSAFAELRVGMRSGPFSGYVSGGGRWGKGEDDARISMGIGYAF